MTPGSNLRLPSGDGQRGGDFESWFFLQARRRWCSGVGQPRARRLVAGNEHRAIMVSSLTRCIRHPDSGSLQVLARTETQRGAGTPVTARSSPTPFEQPAAGLAGHLRPRPTAPSSPPKLRTGVERARVVTVNVKGSGDNPCSTRRTGDRRRGTGTASDFSATFTVGTAEQP